MSLTLNEVRVPTPSVRARKILAALSATGDITEYVAAGAIAITDGVALIAPTSAAMAMTLAASAVVGSTIRLEMTRQAVSTYTAVVTVAGPGAGVASVTLDAVGEYAVLVSDGADWYEKASDATVS